MEKDYYHILGLTKDASEDEIAMAYSFLAHQLHPDFNHGPDASPQFQEVSEAYDVLSSVFKREIFDKYGEEGLKNGFPDSQAGSILYLPYHYHGDALFTFAQYIGSGKAIIPKQDPPTKQDIVVSLVEVMRGVTKKFQVVRKFVQRDGTIVWEENFLTFTIPPGCTAGTRFVFEKIGDQALNVIPSDLVFIIKDEHHPFYTRSGCDLIFTAKVSLGQALCGTIINVPTPCGKNLQLDFQDEIITPSTVRTLVGLGLPMEDAPNRIGDLIVRFDIVFPISLPEDAKKCLSNILN